ncbi:IS3 family transposase [Tropicimonas sp. TH_r6]|uniref:IS3 family transposase n=1 Tax=Tropicimonas sp. TH_r6 TaxID=3082085 RepID=UPI0029558DC4|nr:IS3 family transposase [Tropicimonas sp. TH_r6]MDV7144321.1 IS3 family transposase [Tropicimonas sp. TH_r6]
MQYRSVARNDDELRLAMIRLAKSYGPYYDRKVAELLRVEGWRVNHKTVERLWGEEGLQQPQRHLEEDQGLVRGTNPPTKEAAPLPRGQFDHSVATDTSEPCVER